MNRTGKCRKVFRQNLSGYLSAGFLISLLFSLVGCKTATEEAVSNNLEAVEELSVIEPISESLITLSGNKAPADYDFMQFKNVGLTINMAEVAQVIAANFYGVRVYDENKNTYFATFQIDIQEIFVQVSLPKNQQRLYVEIFSDVGGENFVIQEINL